MIEAADFGEASIRAAVLADGADEGHGELDADVLGGVVGGGDAEAHGGRLELDEGPGKVGEMGPGLRVAFVLPRAA